MEPGSSPARGHRRAETGLQADKGAMDVHSFTRMLLTGKKDTPGTSDTLGGESNLKSNSTSGDSNSTDTSSVSRQSVFDASQAPQVESPRTSYDETSVSDDENSTPMKREPDKEKKKPPPPKSRHGKGIVQRAPQTVSFSDFSTNLASPDPPSPSLQRVSTDPGKSLPSLPESSTDNDPEATDDIGMPQVARTPSERSVPQIQPAPPQRKSPPAVPLARRHSQLKTTQSRQRSNSALTTDSADGPSSNAPSIAESTSSAPKTAPPPPPTRRRGHASKDSISLTSPPVDSTSTGALAQALSNSSQNASQNSLSSPPPPPPRRRGGSGRASSEMQRPNMGELTRGSFDSARRGSGASSVTSPRKDSSSAMASPMEEKDEAGGASSILADMDAFQREIDALRKAQEAGSGR